MSKHIAVWRLGAGVQTEYDSKVGGGWITSRLLLALRSLGHRVTVFGPTSERTIAWMGKAGITYDRDGVNISRFDGALIFTGVFNLMYGKGVIATYERLATFNGPVAYAQWDEALPFTFHPEASKGFPAHLGTESLHRDKRWFVLTQLAHEDLLGKKSATVGYHDFPYEHRYAMWERYETLKPRLPPKIPAVPILAYCGSQRKGRLKEMERYLRNYPTTFDLYGKWKQEVAEGMFKAVRWFGPVPEWEVPHRLNEYVATLYLTEPGYMKRDFVAQRFFENATAGVPVVYSNTTQARIGTIPKEWVAEDSNDLVDKVTMWSHFTLAQRQQLVAEQRAFVDGVAATIPLPTEVLKEVFA